MSANPMRSIVSAWRLLAAAAAMTLAACQHATPYRQPDVAIPTQFTRAGPVALGAEPASVDWWRRFGNAELDRLMELALADNLDVKAATARVLQARANARIIGANLQPTLAAISGAATELRAGDDNSRNTFTLIGLQARHEFDVWGRNRQAFEAELARAQSSAYAEQAVRLLLQSDLASAFFDLQSARDRLALARGSLANSQALLKLLEVQHASGALSSLELERQRGLVASVRAGIAPIELERQLAEDTLAVLTGQPPGATLAIADRKLTRSALPPIEPGLPAQLLTRRPDIRQAEAELIAANADVNAARGALLPSISLTATGGQASRMLRDLLSSGNVIYNLAANVAAPIIFRDRLLGGVDFSEARREELTHNYRRAILFALREVEANLAAANRLAEQEADQKASIDHAQAALRAAELRFKNGAVDFTTVLDAQRVLLSAQFAQEQTLLARHRAAVALFRALGGGWDTGPPLAANH